MDVNPCIAGCRVLVSIGMTKTTLSDVLDQLAADYIAEHCPNTIRALAIVQSGRAWPEHRMERERR